jgi:hypothetical protein
LKRIFYYIFGALFISLFIYLFYRTEKTVVNDLLIMLLSRDHYIALKHSIQNQLPLSEFIVFSLPEGLWVFCITLTSRGFYIKIKELKINCIVFPLLIAIGLEFFQLFGVANGRFDYADIISSVLFWLLGCYIIIPSTPKKQLFKTFDDRTALCLSSYAIIFLAHVWK